MPQTRRIRMSPPLALAGLVLLSLFSTVVRAENPIEECLLCHEDPDLVMSLDDGGEMPVFIDADAFLASVHGEALVCADCHPEIQEGFASGEHPSGATAPSRRAYVLGAYELCKECHFETYTRTLESIHYELSRDGVEEAPVCSDCHGAHDIPDPHQKQIMVDRSCAVCHGDVAEDFAASVHGAALATGDPEVPGCASCHTAHSVEPPHTMRFRLASPTLCLDCHADPDLVRRRGLSPWVETSYVADFHGVTAALAAGSEKEPTTAVVVCVDCHGVHDMQSPRKVGTAAMEARVEKVCADCHEDAPPGFSAAWLSHYPLTFEHAPLTFLVTWLYRLLIPLIIGGLLLQVCLHLYRVGWMR